MSHSDHGRIRSRHGHASLPRIAGACLAALALTHGLRGSPQEHTPDGWELLQLLRFTEARLAFAEETGEDSWRTFGRALSLLNAPPKTRARLAEARRLFERVAATPDQDLHIAARYYLARIDQVHAYEPDWPAARRQFSELLADFPDHALAQLGAAKIALLDLYDPTLPDPLEERFNRLTEMGRALTDPAARRDFHYVMGCAAIYHDLPDRLALDHLIASRDAGLTNDVNRANVFIRIAETARALGEIEIARDHYQRFLQVAHRDRRARLARERLMELGENPEALP